MDKIINLPLITVFLLISNISEASYVVYNRNDSSYSYSTPIESLPYTTSGFYYVDQGGNSISYRESHGVPVIVNQYNNAVWAWMNNGMVPANAIILEYINGSPVFYCRVKNGNRLFYGKLIPNQGCYIPDIPGRPFNVYQTLIR